MVASFHASTYDVVDMKSQHIKEAQLGSPSAKLRDEDIIETEFWDRLTCGTSIQNYWKLLI